MGEEDYKDTIQELTISYKLRDTGDKFKVTTIYARCNALERLELWDDLQDITCNNNTAELLEDI